MEWFCPELLIILCFEHRRITPKEPLCGKSVVHQVEKTFLDQA